MDFRTEHREQMHLRQQLEILNLMTQRQGMDLAMVMLTQMMYEMKTQSVVYFDQRLGAAHPNAGRNSSKTTEF
jgi:hypothetical protein